MPLSDEQAAALRARIEDVLERVGSRGRSCPLCHRAEIVAQVAREHPGWSRLRVELDVDALLAQPAWHGRPRPRLNASA